MAIYWYGCKIIVVHCVQKWGGNFYVSGRDDIFLLDAGIRGFQINDTRLQPFSKLPQNFEFNVPTCRNKKIFDRTTGRHHHPVLNVGIQIRNEGLCTELIRAI